MSSDKEERKVRTRNDRYKRGKMAKDGTMQSTIWAGNHILLDFYCKRNNINKTHYVNEAVKEKLERDMKNTKAEISMWDLFNLENPEGQNTDGYEQIGIPGIE